MKKKIMLVAAALILIGFIGLAFNKFELSNRAYIPFEHEWEYGGNIEFNSVKINNVEAKIDVAFEVSPDNNIYIKVKGQAERTVLDSISQSAIVNGQFILDISSQQNTQWFSLGIDNNYTDVVVFLPSGDSLQHLEVQSQSGDITLSNVHIVEGRLKAMSSDIRVKDSNIGVLDASTMSGDMDVIQYKGDLIANTNSGDINLEQLSGSSNIKSDSGDVKVVQFEESILNIETTSGDVDVDQKKSSFAHIKVNSGDVKLKINEQFGGQLSLNSNSGDVKSPKLKSGTIVSEHEIMISSTSGDITVTK